MEFRSHDHGSDVLLNYVLTNFQKISSQLNSDGVTSISNCTCAAAALAGYRYLAQTFSNIFTRQPRTCMHYETALHICTLLQYGGVGYALTDRKFGCSVSPLSDDLYVIQLEQAL